MNAPMRIFLSSKVPSACSGKSQFQSNPVARKPEVNTDKPLDYFAVIISDLPSLQCVGSRFVSSSLQEPLLLAESSADPHIQPNLERLLDQIADPCFKCDPIIMASIPCNSNTR
ncbi:hypothetical protein AYI69_g11412 [Smittium culicis]|uniref:Uncharacterized protein n=1 Tax=Smittium culicis TaxID=133412 RepID=A0A1R1WYX7_9FUNG|nr:hypothetical protein AYI69_g11412 [Smittium culicis]